MSFITAFFHTDPLLFYQHCFSEALPFEERHIEFSIINLGWFKMFPKTDQCLFFILRPIPFVVEGKVYLEFIYFVSICKSSQLFDGNID